MTGVERFTRPAVPRMAWWILLLSSIDSVLSLVDRQAVAVLKVELKTHFQMGDAQYGLLASAFLLAYGLFNIPAGRLADRIGSRIALTAFIGAWSLATAATAIASSYPELVAWRFVLGAAEAGLIPTTMIALMRWFPPDRIATAYSLRGPVTALGPILAPPIVVALTLAFGWQEAFYVLGAIGLVFGLAWWLSDRPAAQTVVTSPPPAFFASLRAMFTDRLFLAIFVARLIGDPLWFFIQFWQAGYFLEVLHLPLARVGSLLWIPPLLSTLATVGIGWLADRLTRRGRDPQTSRVIGLAIVTLLAPCTALIPWTGSVGVALGLFTAAQFVAWAWIVVTSVMAAMLAPKGTAATALACLNTPGILMGAAANGVAGSAIQAWGYTPVFLLLACLHPIALAVVSRATIRRSFAERNVSANASGL